MPPDTDAVIRATKPETLVDHNLVPESETILPGILYERRPAKRPAEIAEARLVQCAPDARASRTLRNRLSLWNGFWIRLVFSSGAKPASAESAL